MIEKINNFHRISEYLERSKVRLRNKNIPVGNIRHYNAKKLEGIQQGIPLFEDMSMAQIMGIAKEKMEFVTKRGCSNMCVHCYANAMPENHYKNLNKATVISFNDYEKFLNGFKELSDRLKFKILGKQEYSTLFHDGDSSSIYLRDKHGQTHDYLDIAKKVNELTDSTVLFDTSGWNIKDKTTQKRMEELVKKAQNSDDYKFMEFNISINPFSPLHKKSLAYKASGDDENAARLRNIYTDRMANVIFTMTPLFEKNNVDFIQRAFKNDAKKMTGYQAKDLKKLIKEITSKVKRLYIQDYDTEQKVITSRLQADKYINLIKEKTKQVSTNLGITGRLINTFKDKINIGKPKKLRKNDLASIIDINGQVYFTDFKRAVKTDIQLNYDNKNADTPEIYPH